MKNQRVMELLMRAEHADFKERNNIGIELAAEIEKPDLKAVFNMLYVQFCQEAAYLLPLLYPFVVAICGERSEGMFAGRIDMSLFINYVMQMNASAVKAAEREDRLRRFDLHGPYTKDG